MALVARRVIAITGCDSGLGWALAARCAREGHVIIAGIYDQIDGPAAQSLKNLTAHVCPLDVTKQESVDGFRDYVRTLLSAHSNYNFYALVNNAGIMTVGEFEWLTEGMTEAMIQVNLLGAMRVTKALLPDLRRAAVQSTVRPRLINITSHCSMQPLPYFSVYSASKGGISAWTKALRIELEPHGVTVVGFLPGGFVRSSNLMSSQTSLAEAMLQNLDQEDQSYHGPSIKIITDSLHECSKLQPYNSLTDENIIETFMKALEAKNPKPMYKSEPWRYTIYYFLCTLPVPEFLHNWFVRRFIDFPKVK